MSGTGSENEPVLTEDGRSKKALGVAGIFGLAAVAVAAIMYYGPEEGDSKSRQEKAAQNQGEDDIPGNPGRPPRKPGMVEELPAAASAPASVAEAAKPGGAAPAVDRPIARRRAYPAGVTTWQAPKPAAPVASPAATAAAPGREDSKPVKMAGLEVMQAERIDDPTWYLFPGDKIMCRNNEPLTEKTGTFWTADIPQEKMDRSGTRQLLPPGSQAFGQVVAGFQNGDRRLSAVITHISTPYEAGKPMHLIPIDRGQVGDDLGRVDMDGNVENNFWGRLGTVGAYAALDAVARGGTSFLAGQLDRSLNGSGGNGRDVNVNVGSLGSNLNGQTLSGRAMESELNKQPAFNRPHAQPCTIMITKPVNFRIKKSLTVGK